MDEGLAGLSKDKVQVSEQSTGEELCMSVCVTVCVCVCVCVCVYTMLP